MKIDILTLFPTMFDGFLSESIIKRAILKNLVEIHIHNIRDYSPFPNKQVDDYPYGGGNGMVLMCEPIFRAIEALKTEDSHVIMMTPDGKKYEQKEAYALAKNYRHLILLCGHYEGFDERIRSLCDEELSIGDYVLTGGELPSMVITDSIVRLVPGVIVEESHRKESFNQGLLDYPNYTHPREFQGMAVPEVLLSGHHENIAKWRLEQQLKRTEERRPDIRNRGVKDEK